jgi:predicted transcriptional regulator
MTIILEPQTETLLREKAQREGQDLNVLANAMLGTVLDWEAQDRAEAVEGIQRGLDDFAAGRYSPAAQVFADIKARHGAGEV